MKLKRIFLTAALLISINLSAQVYSSRQLIPSGHWIYDALYHLNLEQKRSSVLDNAPLSVDELYLNFLQIDEDNLSQAGKQIYLSVEEFFERKKFLLDFSEIKFTANIILNPTAVIRTNPEVDWTYASSYTELNNYVSTDLMGKVYSEPVAVFPFILDFAQTAYINVEPYAGAGPFWALTSDFYALNIPTGNNGAEFFMWPINADANIGHVFNGWGAELLCGRQGLEIGRTLSGSMIYNSSFQSDYFVQLNLFSPRLKYSMDIVQLDVSRFFYVHSAEIVPFTWLKLGIMEGTLVHGPFELRYLNPLIFMHAYSAWRQYSSEDELKYYGEAHYCAYFGWSFDITPCPYLRIYGLYSQNEIQSSVELNNDYDYSYPDSIGLQLGTELSIPAGNSGGYFKAGLEGIYTTPYMYLKQTKEASLVRIRENDVNSYGLGLISSWIGSPFGPDAAGGEISFGFKKPLKFNADLSYLFLAHGTNSFGLFDKKDVIKGYYSYYPSALYLQEKELGNNVAAKTTQARSYALTNEVSYTNRIQLSAEFYFLKNLSIQGSGAYTFIFNHKGKAGEFAHSAEFMLGASYSVF